MKGATLTSLFFTVRLPTLLVLFWRRYLAREPVTRAAVSTPDTHSRREPLSIVVFRLDSLGDVVLTTPLFRELKRAFPAVRCTVVVQEAYRSLLVTNPHIDEVLSLSRVKPAWLPERAQTLLSAILFYRRRLRGRRFDWAISPRWDTDEHLATFLCLLTNAARRVGYGSNASPAKRRNNRGFDVAFSHCLPSGPLRHEAFRNLAIVEALGGKASDCGPEIRLTERDRRKAAVLLAQAQPCSGKLVAIGIGAHSPGRRWPLQRYAEVLLRLGKERNIQPVILCSSEERGEADKLAGLLGGRAILVSGAPLRHVCAVLELCGLFLGNDSGCAHLAAAMNCRTIVISRHPRDGDPNHSNSPLRFAPLGNCVRILQPPTGLDSCKVACCLLEPHCITGVSADEVVGAAREFLRRVHPAVSLPQAKPWLDKESRHLVHSHSSEAMRRAVEVLRNGPGAPLSPV